MAVLEYINNVSQFVNYGSSTDIIYVNDMSRTSGNPFVYMTGLAVNNGTVYQGAGLTDVWVMQHNGTIQASWFAQANQADDYWTLKNCLNYANIATNNVKEIIFEYNKTYLINNSHVFQIMTGNFNSPDLYLLSRPNVIIRGNNSTIDISGNYTINSSTTNPYRNVKFGFDLCNDVIIEHLTLNCHRLDMNDLSGGLKGAAAHGLHLSGCHRVDLQDVHIIEARVDGFNFNKSGTLPCRSIKMVNCSSEFAGRQGLQITQAVGLHIENFKSLYAGQCRDNICPWLTTPPTYNPIAGCDIEPNKVENVDELTADITILNSVFAGNVGHQFTCGGSPLKYNRINIEGCLFSDDYNNYKGKDGITYVAHFGGGQSVNIRNNTFVMKGGPLWLVHYQLDENPYGNVSFENNTLYCDYYTWLETGNGVNSMVIKNNCFIDLGGNSILYGVERMINLVQVNIGLFKDNYFFIGYQRFPLFNPDPPPGPYPYDFKYIANFQKGWLVQNNVFETDLSGTKYFLMVAYKGSVIKENITKGSAMGYIDNIRFTKPGGPAVQNPINHDSHFPITFSDPASLDERFPNYSVGNALHTGKRVLVKHNQLQSYSKIGTAPSIPTAGFYTSGDILLNETVAVGGILGWICITSGTPGIWAPMGIVGAKKVPLPITAHRTPAVPTVLQ